MALPWTGSGIMEARPNPRTLPPAKNHMDEMDQPHLLCVIEQAAHSALPSRFRASECQEPRQNRADTSEPDYMIGRLSFLSWRFREKQWALSRGLWWPAKLQNLYFYPPNARPVPVNWVFQELTLMPQSGWPLPRVAGN